MTDEFDSDQYRKSELPFNGQDRQLLARLDERTKAMQGQLNQFVTKEAFKPVMLIAYGIMTAIATGVLGSLLALILVTK